LEDVGHGGGVQKAGVEEAEVMTEAEVMNNDDRKEKRASRQRRLHEAELSMVKEAKK
jgi:hypothetical protein